VYLHIRLAVSGVVACGLFILTARADDAAAADLAKFAGKWKVVSIMYEGQKLKAGYTQEVVGDRILFGAGWYGKVTLHPKETPRRFDIDHYDAGGRPRERERYKGIYEFDGDDTLRWCISQKTGEPYPRSFESKPGDNTRLFVLQRVKKK